jgi:hypothetical protein
MRHVVCAAAVVGMVLISTVPESTAKPKPNHDPEAARLVTSDLPNFVRALDHASALGTDAEKERVLKREYLDKGSRGLKDFVELRIQSASNLVQAIAARPKYYASLEGAVRQVSTIEPAIRKSFRELKALDPDAVFPDVYFLIGVMNSGGTTSDAGLLIGLDMHAKTPETDMSEMSDWLKTVLGPLDALPGIVAHELMHFQQGPEGKTLLEKACGEGFADFVGNLVSGQNINDHLRAYGDAHEAELWHEFSAAMDGDDLSHWLYQGTKSKDRPADLGYYVGFRIAEAYYDRSDDKKKAVRDILTVRDYPALLRASGYAEKFKAE